MQKEIQDKQMREAFELAFNQAYEHIIELLNKLSLAPLLKSHCFMNLDQGAYWAREAIRHMEFNFQQPSEVTPVVETTGEATLDHCVEEPKNEQVDEPAAQEAA